MKRLSTFIVGICAILIAANLFLFFSFNSKLESMNSKLDRLEAQLTGVRGNMGSVNNIPGGAAVKEKEVFTPSELAVYLGVEMSKVYDLIDASGVGLPYVCIDGEYRFGKEAIDEWLKTNINLQTGN